MRRFLYKPVARCGRRDHDAERIFQIGVRLTLTDPPPAQAAPALRDLADADDSRLLEVLRYLDSLPDRGTADGLVAPVRDRLRRLRPPRIWRFPRLLFTPLDIVLVPNDAWRVGSGRLPRAIIAPVAEMVRRALPTQTTAAERLLARKTHPTHENVAAAGALVWPKAGGALRADNEMPPSMAPSWATTGLPGAAFRPLAFGVAAGLDAACRVAALSHPFVPPEAVEAGITATLRQAKTAGSDPWGIVLTLALQHFPRSAATRAAIRQHDDPIWGQACASAVAACWSWLEAGAAATGLGTSAAFALDLRRRIALLDAFGDDSARHRRALAVRAKLRAACARQLEAGAQDLIIAPLRSVTEADASGEGFMQTLEAGAWSLRRFNAEASRLGEVAACDAALRDAAGVVHGCALLQQADRQHLIDILLVRDAAPGTTKIK